MRDENKRLVKWSSKYMWNTSPSRSIFPKDITMMGRNQTIISLQKYNIKQREDKSQVLLELYLNMKSAQDSFCSSQGRKEKPDEKGGSANGITDFGLLVKAKSPIVGSRSRWSLFSTQIAERQGTATKPYRGVSHSPHASSVDRRCRWTVNPSRWW